MKKKIEYKNIKYSYIYNKNMNKNIIDKLSQLYNIYNKDSKLKFKSIAISKALSHIKQYPENITSGNYAKKNISNIGVGISKRIDEIIETGTLSELKEYEESGKNNELDTIQEFKRITGVGDVRARNLIKMNIKTIDQYRQAIKDKKVKTTHHIDIGLKYLDDLEKRIPRKEIEKVENYVCEEIKLLNPKLIFNICGSYRRGKETCGDVDILITNFDKKNIKENKEYLTKLVDNLTKKNFLIDHLTINGDTKYMGIYRLFEYARRIDIRFVDYSAYYAALIYFTGSKNFNIQIRNKAIELGYSLSEYGLFNKNTDELIILHSEKELFDLLGIEYVSPLDRELG